MIKNLRSILLLGMFLATTANAQERIVCEADPKGGNSINSIWPTPYLSPKGQLCFDVKGWPEYKGQKIV